jgi:two-component system chemotaxis response regulator CheB
MNKIRVLICDDSALMRRQLTKIIESDSELEVIGCARDGDDAITKAHELHPDVITMDINMPGIDGITAMQIIMEDKIAPVVMVSSLTSRGAEVTFECLALGAFDYIEKPGGTVSANLTSVARNLINKIKAAAALGTMDRLSRKPVDMVTRLTVAQQREKRVTKSKSIGKESGVDFKAVAIGISTGGPKTIFEVLPLLPADLNAAVILVQHMPANFTAAFAKRIDEHSKMSCMETAPGMILQKGKIYVARGGYHSTLLKKSSGEIVFRTPQRPEHQFMPSVDVMMSSVLEVFGRDTVGVLMTGMGDDGAKSMVQITEAGGDTIAESEETAIVFGMCGEAIRRGGAKVIAPSYKIAEKIIQAVER